MRIKDPQGRPIGEVTIELASQEITELLVAASGLEERADGHALISDTEGRTLALYRLTGEQSPLERHVDWWLGPVILLAAILVVVGVFTIARGIIDLLF